MKYWVVFWTVYRTFTGIETDDHYRVFDNEEDARACFARVSDSVSLVCAGWGPIAGGTDWEAE